jgi:aspartate aminotransferase-like enzyme
VNYYLTEVLHRYHAKHPKVRVKVLDAGANEVLAAVAALELTLPKFGHPVKPGEAVAACQKAYAATA